MLRAGLKILLKDALRSARDQMRRSGEGELPLPLPGARRLSRVADDVLSSIEETVVCVRYGSDQTTDLIGVALEGVARLRTEGQSEDFEADFAATMYRLAKGILALRGLERIRLSERGLAMAGRDVRRALQAAPHMTHGTFAATFARTLVAAEPPAIRSHQAAVTRIPSSPSPIAPWVWLLVLCWLPGSTGCKDECGRLRPECCRYRCRSLASLRRSAQRRRPELKARRALRGTRPFAQ